MNLVRFIAVLVGTFIGLPALAALIQSLAGIDISSAAFAVIPAFTAALVEGQAIAKARNAGPTRAEKTTIAAWAFGLTFALQALATILLASLLPDLRMMLFAGENAAVLWIVTLVFALLAAGSAYFFAGFGASNFLKAEARKAARKK